ncbi:hypothetical protein [Methylobacterium sp. J-067]|uniref:hypothetical protein n=1 Tax=Methylobacterium sp. J-067 TaxID=2836648 RepID=UPI001FB8CB5B|nr:hypothetical protein [Methylobacterium sp. J-067]MCJ2023132.1 hypothetical protein [Methylobacterium sp. J-067]
MSVDLVGSTAFKAKHRDRREGNEPYPVWLNRTRSFYRQFPQILSERYGGYLGAFEGHASFADRSPKVWKTIGDEIIFCIRITCLEHLACCLLAFTKALSAYGELINDQEPELDVKGSAWVASFPAPNATVASASRLSLEPSSSIVGDQLGEDDEKRADVTPGDYDFLGKQIDTGFRISKFAQRHELALSIDLVWLLTLLKHLNLIDFQFTYRGKEVLKGVIAGVPYPVITVQTERSVARRELDALERAVAGISFAEHIGLRNYTHMFMMQNDIEIPIIALHRETYSRDELPQCYKDLEAAWDIGEKEDAERQKSNQEAGQFIDPLPASNQTVEGPENIDEINIAIDKLVDKFWSKGPI